MEQIHSLDDGEVTKIRRHLLPAVTLLLVFLLMAFVRWPGALPYGSDSDEHWLVAKTLMERGGFAVDHLHGTKYPPAISALLVLFASLGFNAPWAMIFVNAALVLLSALFLYYLVAQTSSRTAAWIGAVFLLSNTVLWNAAYLLIAEPLFLFLMIGVLFLSLSARAMSRHRILAGVLLASACVMTRAVGVAAAVTLSLVFLFIEGHRLDLRTAASRLVLLVIPLAMLGLYAIWQAGYGAHPTGYAETFFLADPFDASRGTVDLYGFLQRTVATSGAALTDVATTLATPYDGLCAHLAGASLLVIAAFSKDRRHLLVIAFYMFPYLALIAVWPYRELRFAIPLLPIAALGVASIAGYRSAGAHCWLCRRNPAGDLPRRDFRRQDADRGHERPDRTNSHASVFCRIGDVEQQQCPDRRANGIVRLPGAYSSTGEAGAAHVLQQRCGLPSRLPSQAASKVVRRISQYDRFARQLC